MILNLILMKMADLSNNDVSADPVEDQKLNHEIEEKVLI